MKKYEAVPNTDGIYKAWLNGAFVGMVKKVYTGRSAHLWTIEPRHYEARTTLRVGYATRSEAYEALAHYTHTGKRSLVEG